MNHERAQSLRQMDREGASMAARRTAGKAVRPAPERTARGH